MNNNSILIISNDDKAGNTLLEKVKLLRACDSLQLVNYIEAISVLNSSIPSFIIVYAPDKESIGIVKEIRNLKFLDRVPVVLAMDLYIEDLVLYAFDNGIDDFFFMNDSDAIILIRIFLILQKAILYQQIDIHNEILISEGIINKDTGIFTKDKAPSVLKTFFNKSIEENLKNTVFMCLKPVPQNPTKVNIQSEMKAIEEFIKGILRGNDVVAYGENSSFYLLLYNAGIQGAKSVFSRVKNFLLSECDIYSVAAEVTNSFEEMEPVLNRSLKEQIDFGIEFNFLYGLNVSEIVENSDIHDETGKKFKDFKKEFYTGFEKMVSPVFYQIQTEAKSLVQDAQLVFDITETESKFSISYDKIKSELVITYPTYMKILVDIKHSVKSKKPQNKRLTFDFDDFSSEKLLAILQDVIKEFAVKVNTEKIENETKSEQE